MKLGFFNTKLKSDASLLAEVIEAFNFKVRDDESVLLLKWIGNKTITMASTVHGKTPISTTKHYSRREKRYIDVKIPSTSIMLTWVKSTYTIE